jgi:hypothetical protein
MRITESKFLVLLVTLAGCLHRSPDAAVLAPIASQLAHGFRDEAVQPQYLIFADPLTESVFKSLTKGTRYRIAPAGSPIVCPSNRPEGLHGYLLRVRVDSLMGDSAIASMVRTCLQANRSIDRGEHILLTRRSGKWAIDKVIDGWTAVSG